MRLEGVSQLQNVGILRKATERVLIPRRQVMQRSFQNLGEFREENKFSTWLIRITVSHSLMKLGNQRATKHTLINKSDGSAQVRA